MHLKPKYAHALLTKPTHAFEAEMLPNQDRDELPVTMTVLHSEVANVHTSSRNDSEFIKENLGTPK
jgi:hypothetical protein